jgi:hypothetical protein
LDVSFYGPLNTAYNQVMDSWMTANPGRAVTQYQISAMLGPAYGKVATVGIATSGFVNTGLWPPNRHIFPDYMFSPSSVTDKSTAASATATTSDVDLSAKEQEETLGR